MMMMMMSRDAADSDLENIGSEGGNVEVLKNSKTQKLNHDKKLSSISSSYCKQLLRTFFANSTIGIRQHTYIIYV